MPAQHDPGDAAVPRVRRPSRTTRRPPRPKDTPSVHQEDAHLRPGDAPAASPASTDAFFGTTPGATPPPGNTGFYAGVLDAADREVLAAARTISGLDQEIAVLRTRLRRLLRDQPDDYALAVRAIELL